MSPSLWGSIGLCALDRQQWSALLAVRVSWWLIRACSERWLGLAWELRLLLASWASRWLRQRSAGVPRSAGELTGSTKTMPGWGGLSSTWALVL